MRSLLLLVCGALLSLPAFSQTSIRMTVNEESRPCRRMIEQTCLLVQKEGVSQWELFYDNIKGFEFEPGYRYEIVVIQTPRPEPVPQDLSRYTYRLDKVISKTAVNASGGTTEKQALATNRWRVVSLNGIQLNTNEVYFHFNGDQTEISGKSGCNGFSTPVSFNRKKTKIKTKSGLGTLIACSDELTKLESNFLSAISGKTFKVRQGEGRMIWKRRGKEVLVLEEFVPEESVMNLDPAHVDFDPNRDAWDYFSGQELKLIQLNGKTITNSRAEMRFDKTSGRITGNNGCNQLFGTFTSEGNKIAFSEVGCTKMACSDKTVAATETAVMTILRSRDLTVDFAEQVLNIYDASGKLVMMLAASK